MHLKILTVKSCELIDEVVAFSEGHLSVCKHVHDEQGVHQFRQLLAVS